MVKDYLEASSKFSTRSGTSSSSSAAAASAPPKLPAISFRLSRFSEPSSLMMPGSSSCNSAGAKQKEQMVQVATTIASQGLNQTRARRCFGDTLSAERDCRNDTSRSVPLRHHVEVSVPTRDGEDNHVESKAVHTGSENNIL